MIEETEIITAVVTGMIDTLIAIRCQIAATTKGGQIAMERTIATIIGETTVEIQGEKGRISAMLPEMMTAVIKRSLLASDLMKYQNLRRKEPKRQRRLKKPLPSKPRRERISSPISWSQSQEKNPKAKLLLHPRKLRLKLRLRKRYFLLQANRKKVMKWRSRKLREPDRRLLRKRAPPPKPPNAFLDSRRRKRKTHRSSLNVKVIEKAPPGTNKALAKIKATRASTAVAEEITIIKTAGQATIIRTITPRSLMCQDVLDINPATILAGTIETPAEIIAGTEAGAETEPGATETEASREAAEIKADLSPEAAEEIQGAEEETRGAGEEAREVEAEDRGAEVGTLEAEEEIQGAEEETREAVEGTRGAAVETLTVEEDRIPAEDVPRAGAETERKTGEEAREVRSETPGPTAKTRTRIRQGTGRLATDSRTSLGATPRKTTLLTTEAQVKAMIETGSETLRTKRTTETTGLEMIERETGKTPRTDGITVKAIEVTPRGIIMGTKTQIAVPIVIITRETKEGIAETIIETETEGILREGMRKDTTQGKEMMLEEITRRATTKIAEIGIREVVAIMALEEEAALGLGRSLAQDLTHIVIPTRVVGLTPIRGIIGIPVRGAIAMIGIPLGQETIASPTTAGGLTTIIGIQTTEMIIKKRRINILHRTRRIHRVPLI